jgi:hypothetical protein
MRAETLRAVGAACLATLLAAGATAVCAAPRQRAATVRVKDGAEFRRAIAAARPGTRILLETGDYPGGFFFSNLHGAPGRPIVIGAADPAHPPHLLRGNCALQLSRVSYIEVRDLKVDHTTDNGLNIDDGGQYESPSHDVTLRNIQVADLPSGNHDGIKLSGIDDFRLDNCTVDRWGGSAVDMVGCHRGLITVCIFRGGGDDAVQCKGGTSSVTVRGCRMENYGERGVNIGGSTGLEFFRPPVRKMPPNAKYEAKDIHVEGCIFIGGVAPVAFVGVDGAVVRYNTIYDPKKWALRILQETKSPGFVPSRNGVFEDNLIVFHSADWTEGGVNIGPGTAPKTFKFARNFWYCIDRPELSKPTLPTPETDEIAGVDPQLRGPAVGDFGVKPSSPALNRGAHALPKPRPALR